MLGKQQTQKSLAKLTKKYFAGGGKTKRIDPNLKDFDIAVIGGLNAAHTIKLLQKKHFHGTIAGFNHNNKFFFEHEYEYFISSNLKSHKYLSMPFSSNYDSAKSRVIREKITRIDPKKNEIISDKGTKYTYKSLLLNTGLSQTYSTIPYIKDLVTDEFAHTRVFVQEPGDIFQATRNLRIMNMHKDGDLIVYLPKTPSRREAYDHWYLMLDSYISRGLLSEALPRSMKIRVITPNQELFKFPFANEVVLDEIKQRSMIEVHYGWEINNVEVKDNLHGKDRFAYFTNTTTGEEIRLRFGTLIVTPKNEKRECFIGNDIADEDGQVTVNPYTLQHTKYPNIFAFGDCTNTPTTKSFYAALNQSVVARNNIWSYLHGEEMSAIYEGYSAFQVHHAIDRIWIFKHFYNYQPSAFNFYVPRFLGYLAFRLKLSLERNYLAKIYQQKESFGYPYLQKDRYFRPLNENSFLRKNKIALSDVIIHKYEKPTLSFEGHHDEHAVAHH